MPLVLSFRTVLFRLPALLIAGGIWFLSSQSTLPQPKGVFGWDKLQHITAFVTLAVAAGLWVPPVFWNTRPVLSLLLVAFIGAAYGAVDELHQYFVPGRESDVWDWLADALGAFLGAAAMLLVMRRLRPIK